MHPLKVHMGNCIYHHDLEPEGQKIRLELMTILMYSLCVGELCIKSIRPFINDVRVSK